MIAITSDDEEEDDETLARCMLSHLVSKIDSFKDSLASLLQMAVEWIHACEGFLSCGMMDSLNQFSESWGHLCIYLFLVQT